MLLRAFLNSFRESQVVRASEHNMSFWSAFIAAPNLRSRVLVWVGLAEYYTVEQRHSEFHCPLIVAISQ